MSEITFLASSKPFNIPDEIEEYNNRPVLNASEDIIFFSVQEIDDYWEERVNGLFSMPYVYEAGGVGNRLFLTYIEKYMEIGEVLEIYYVPSQNDFDEYKQRLLEHPEPIDINIGQYTYKTFNGLYRLNPKKWVEELSHRNYLSPYGITTFVNY